MKSLPLPAKTSEPMSVPRKMKSWPSLPMTRSRPGPAWTTSLPAPALMLSSPPLSLMMSSPSPPLMMSLPKPAFEQVIAAIAEHRVVADARDDRCRRRRCRRGRRARRRCSGDSWCPTPGVAGLSRMTSGVAGSCRAGRPRCRRSRPRSGGIALQDRRAPASSPRSLNCLVRSTSRIRPGVENTSDGRCVASVLRMIIAAKELFSISPNRCRPSRRCR